MIAQIGYTNSNCQDVWEMFVGEIKKQTKIPLYMISDKKVDFLDNDSQIIYDNSDPYYKVWVDAVQKFGQDYFIYLQEDFVLYDKVDDEKINEYVEFLKNNPQYSFVRLLKSGNLGTRKLSLTLYEIESMNPNIFAMQATIWRSSDYILLMNTVKSNGWLETDADYRNNMISLGISGVYHYDGEPKRGGVHYDSNVYPYIATALVKSKWDMSEYDKELREILTKYKVDVNKRGII